MNNPFETPGAFSWSELMTGDPAAAKGFYGALFGWEFQDMAMGEMAYTVVKAGGEDAGGLMCTPPEAGGAPPRWGVYVTVADADATARRAVELGGTVLVPPKDIPDVGRFCVLQDPQGAAISAIAYARK